MPGRSTRGATRSENPLAHLESDGPRPVYAIDGEERILVDEAVRAIKAASLPARAADFNLDVFAGKDATAERVIGAARTLPCFAERRLVIVKELDKSASVEAEADALIAYVSDPSPSTVLVLVFDKLDARTRLYKALQKHGMVLRFPHPSPADMPHAIRQRAKAAKIAIEDDAIRALVDCVGTDVGGALLALEKLALYTAGRPIARADVEALVSPAKEESVFAFSDAIGTGNVAAALALLHAMLVVSREHPLRLLALIASHWRRLVSARALLDAGAPRAEIEVALGMPPFVVDKTIAQARRQSRQKLIDGLQRIAETDRALKGGGLSGDRVMERLVLSLAR